MKKDSFVKIDYTGKTDDGTVVDTTSEKVAKDSNIFDKDRIYKSVPIVVGAGMTLKGIDEALESMKVGEKKKIVLDPIDAFGERNPELTQLVPLKEFKKQGVTPVPGMAFEVEGRMARVQAVSGGRVRLDFNHPLAGRVLNYEVHVVEEATTQKQKIAYLAERNFMDASIKATVTGKKMTVEIPEGMRANRALLAMKAGFFAEVTKYLGVDSIDFVESWAKKGSSKK